MIVSQKSKLSFKLEISPFLKWKLFFQIAYSCRRSRYSSHIRTFLAIKSVLNFYAPTKSREGNLDSFLLLFLIFCLLYKKQIDPNDIGKVRKNFNVKNGKQKKIMVRCHILSKEKLRTSSLL